MIYLSTCVQSVWTTLNHAFYTHTKTPADWYVRAQVFRATQRIDVRVRLSLGCVHKMCWMSVGRRRRLSTVVHCVNCVCVWCERDCVVKIFRIANWNCHRMFVWTSNTQKNWLHFAAAAAVVIPESALLLAGSLCLQTDGLHHAKCLVTFETIYNKRYMHIYVHLLVCKHASSAIAIVNKLILSTNWMHGGAQPFRSSCINRWPDRSVDIWRHVLALIKRTSNARTFWHSQLLYIGIGLRFGSVILLCGFDLLQNRQRSSPVLAMMYSYLLMWTRWYTIWCTYVFTICLRWPALVDNLVDSEHSPVWFWDRYTRTHLDLARNLLARKHDRTSSSTSYRFVMWFG